MTIEELIQKLGIADDKREEASKTLHDYLDGNYVTKSRFNEVNEEKKTLKTTVAERDKQLETLKNSKGDTEGADGHTTHDCRLKNSKGDTEALKAQIKQLQTENNQAKEKYEDQMKNLKLTTAIQLAIGDSAQDVGIVSGLFDRDKLILGEDGKVTGLDEQLKALKESKPFLFKAAPGNLPKYSPNGGGGNNLKNPFAKETFNMTEQGKLLRENPEQAKAFAAAAGVTLNV